MLYCNCQSVIKKLEELKVYVFDIKPDVICLNETWTNDDHTNGYLSLPGYEVVCRYDRTDTENGRGGGLLVYRKVGTNVSENICDNYAKFNQCCSVNIPLNSGQCFELILVYRPHKLYDGSSISSNNDNLNNVLDTAAKPCVLVGDFNYSGIDWNHLHSDSVGRSFLNKAQDLFFHQHVDFPTHRTGTMPDLVLSSDAYLVRSVEALGRLGGSDHSMLLIDVTTNISANTTYEEIPDWKNADRDKLKQILANTNWDSIRTGNAADSWQKFKEIINKAEEECVPKKRRRVNNRPLWMNRNILRRVRKKRRLWKTYQKTQDYQQFLAYKKVEKDVQKSVRRAKRNLERKLAKHAKKNPKAFYKYLNSKTSNRQTVGPLKEGDETITEDERMANMLNLFFTSVFTKEDLSNCPDPVTTYFGECPLEDVQFDPGVITDKINNLKTGSSPGPDKKSPRLLQEIADIISQPLSFIFAQSLREGYVPTDWKTANITPIFKKGLKSYVGNYRPVSLTSVICKVMESILKDAIMKHIISNNILARSQHGFLSKRSCLTNLLEYLDTLTKLVDEGHSVDVVYLDFSKAFDKVPHKRLLSKLHAAGVRGKLLQWIEAWLTNRQQRTVLNGKSSEWSDVLSGVPQGSVLGPILFIIFINDIDGVISMYSIISKFADDTKLFRIVNSDSDRADLQADIDKLFRWSCEWNMLFNSSKCSVIHFGRHNLQCHYTMDGYAPAGTVLDNVAVEKDLGVMIHSSLKPTVQCATAVNKANMILGQMARAFSYRDKYTWIRLYRMYVRPHLEYAVQSWCPWTDANIQLMESVQVRAVRMVSGLKASSYEEKLREVNLTTLVERRKRGDMIEVWKIMHGKDDIDPGGLFCLVDDYSSRLTRRSNSLMLVQPKARLDIRKYSFSHRVVDDWNRLPDELKSASCLLTFKINYDKLS